MRAGDLAGALEDVDEALAIRLADSSSVLHRRVLLLERLHRDAECLAEARRYLERAGLGVGSRYPHVVWLAWSVGRRAGEHGQARWAVEAFVRAWPDAGGWRVRLARLERASSDDPTPTLRAAADLLRAETWRPRSRRSRPTTSRAAIPLRRDASTTWWADSRRRAS